MLDTCSRVEADMALSRSMPYVRWISPAVHVPEESKSCRWKKDEGSKVPM